MSSTARRNSAQEKNESSTTKNEQSPVQTTDSHKITNFFPVLRTEGRAKMCASKMGDSKQKEILQKLKSKDAGLTKPKKTSAAMPAEKLPKADSSQIKERPQRNISVMSALKTPLSQVLRKSIEASEIKKEPVEDQEEDAQGKGSEKEPKTKQSARKSFPETETGRALRRSQKAHQTPSNVRTYPKRTIDSNQTPTTAIRRRVTVFEPDEVVASKNSKTSNFLTGSVSTVASISSVGEDVEHSAGGKIKKSRRRHFRGGTYGLYLSKKAAKKKKEKLMEELKDDDCSLAGTENSSYVDSEDGNSMMSEDLYATSEKSLVDEEQSRTSPVLASDSKVDVESPPENKEEIRVKPQSPDRCASDEVTQIATDVFEEMQWESESKLADNDKLISETQLKSDTEFKCDVQFQAMVEILPEAQSPFESLLQSQVELVSNRQFPADTEFQFDKQQPHHKDEQQDLQTQPEEFKLQSENQLQSESLIQSEDQHQSESLIQSEDQHQFENQFQPENLQQSENQFQPEDQIQSEEQIQYEDQLQTEEQIQYEDQLQTEEQIQCEDQLQTEEHIQCEDELQSNDPIQSEDQFQPEDEMQHEDHQMKPENQLQPEDKLEPDNQLIQPENELQLESEFKLTASFSSESLKAPQYDDISNESFSNSTTFLFKASPALSGDSDKKYTDGIIPDKVEEIISKLDDLTEEDMMVMPQGSNIFKNEEKEFLPVPVDKENFGLLEFSNGNDSPVLEQNENETPMEYENETQSSPVIKSGDEMEAHMTDEEDKDEDPDAQSTIATCVKSRQRIKRRFTDDVVDTDLGILSLHSAMVAPRKPPVPAVPRKDPPKNVIQTFEPVTHREAKRGPVTKIECIFNSHQDPIKSCTCNGETFEANLSEEDEGVFCQAVDSIDDKLVGCSNPVATPRLVRPSVKIPFTIMCEMHLWRLRHHHSCPYCGLFCSQGSFVQCASKNEKQQKVIHLFHEQCQPREEGMVPFCMHCGETSGLKRVQLEMHMASPPSFFLSQLRNVEQTVGGRARISFSAVDYLKKPDSDPNIVEYKIEDTGKILSSVGLNSGPEKDELDRLLLALKEEKIIPAFNTNDELYDAATEGNIIKILNLLAQGMDPNKKFSNHDNETAVHAAAAGGHTTIVHLLIQAGAVNDPLNEKMYTPLMLSSENNHRDVTFYLVKNGAAADFKGDNGMSSFHIAAKCGNLDILKILMTSRDIDINSQDDGGWTPIVWASEHDHYNVVKHLLKSGANPNLKDNEGNTGLHWSAFSGSVDICFLYLDYGCDINAVNERGDTPLHIASRQDSLPCVTLLLSRGADSQIKNKADLIAAECVLDKNSDVYLSLSLNLLLKKIANKYQHKAEKILHKDISRGKEQYAIQCVNEVDDESPPLNFLYVTENCETTPMNIDRTITSLQSCNCEDDCSSSSCTCAVISYQCWYDKDGLLLPNFNMVDPPMLFECNRACSCWSLNCRNRVLQNGMTCRLQLVRTKGKGWGVRTLKDIPKGTFICEYVGEMISDSAADIRADDSYLFDLDNRDGETYCLDARYYGNISRFINHLCEPNLVPVKIYVDHQDLNFPRIAFFSSRDIKQYEELGFDYCEKFWVIKYKFFTCDCGSPKCKYSKETIHQTLTNYYRRVKEEQMLEEQQQPTTAPPIATTEIQTIE